MQIQAKPLQRLHGKTDAATVRARNHTYIEKALADTMDRDPASTDEHDDHSSFWNALGDDLDEHAKHLREHSEKASKLAETVRTITVTKKVAGRTVPNSTHYVQTITRKSDTPFKKS